MDLQWGHVEKSSFYVKWNVLELTLLQVIPVIIST